MGRVLHGCATTTEALRRAIQHSQESLRSLSRRYGINPKTVAKWKKRGSVADLKTGPKDAKSTVLSIEDEAIVVAFRKHTLLPLDDCLYALQATIPHRPVRPCTAVSSAMASRGCRTSKTAKPGSASSRSIPSATSTSISPKFAPRKGDPTSSWPSTGLQSSPSQSCTRRPPLPSRESSSST